MVIVSIDTNTISKKMYVDFSFYDPCFLIIVSITINILRTFRTVAPSWPVPVLPS